MSEEKDVTLYKATWCGHCVKFESEWKKLIKELPKIGMTFEALEFDANSDKAAEENVELIPTLIIKIDGKKIHYPNGNGMTADDIMNFIKNKGKVDTANTNKFKQCGGTRVSKLNKPLDDEQYKVKYLKYKALYMKSLAEKEF